MNLGSFLLLHWCLVPMGRDKDTAPCLTVEDSTCQGGLRLAAVHSTPINSDYPRCSCREVIRSYEFRVRFLGKERLLKHRGSEMNSLLGAARGLANLIARPFEVIMGLSILEEFVQVYPTSGSVLSGSVLVLPFRLKP